MRLSINELTLFTAPFLSLIYALIINESIITGLAGGAGLAAALIAALRLKGWGGWRIYSPLIPLWLSMYAASAVTGNYELASASASLIVTGLALIRVLGIESGYGGALASLALSLLAGEGLANAAAYGGTLSKYLTYALSPGIYRWVPPPPIIRFGYAVSITYLLIKYLLIKSGMRRASALALVGGAAWAVLTLAITSSSNGLNASLAALLMIMAPLLVFTAALRLASR